MKKRWIEEKEIHKLQICCILDEWQPIVEVYQNNIGDWYYSSKLLKDESIFLELEEDGEIEKIKEFVEVLVAEHCKEEIILYEKLLKIMEK